MLLLSSFWLTLATLIKGAMAIFGASIAFILFTTITIAALYKAISDVFDEPNASD